MMKSKYIIYCDMDGVLTNFILQTQLLTGKSWFDLQAISDEYAWGEVEKHGKTFWSEMPLLDSKLTVWNHLLPYHPKILSSPSRSIKECIPGKNLWIDSHLGPNTERYFARARDKRNYASKNSILIDDMERNIEQFREDGGIGILHLSTEQTLEELRKLGIT